MMFSLVFSLYLFNPVTVSWTQIWKINNVFSEKFSKNSFYSSCLDSSDQQGARFCYQNRQYSHVVMCLFDTVENISSENKKISPPCWCSLDTVLFSKLCGWNSDCTIRKCTTAALRGRGPQKCWGLTLTPLTPLTPALTQCNQIQFFYRERERERERV